MVKLLKKYFKLPDKNLCIVYAVFIGLLSVAFLTVYFTAGKTLTTFISDTQSFNAWLKSYENFSAIIFVLIRAFQTVIKIIPAEPLEIAAGYAFGTFKGLLLCSLGTFIGSLFIVLIAKTAGKKFIDAFVKKEQLELIEKSFTNHKNKDLFLWIFYLVPGTPKDIFTYIISSTQINLVRFFVITTVARIPSIITSTICGSELYKSNIKTAIIIFVITGAISLICTVIYKMQRGKVAAVDGQTGGQAGTQNVIY